tara:strand:+ start:427 stop:876 length:450 start_codon:yes stop_codon:yes gene_type:complete
MSITITEVRNAQSLQSDNLRLDVEINHPVYGWMPYTVDPSDTDTTIDNNEVMALVGATFTAYVATTSEALLTEERASMTCTPLQGKFALGEALWGKVLAYRDTATWPEQMVIDDSAMWGRTSQDIQFIGYIVGVTDLEMDDLFRLAVTL